MHESTEKTTNASNRILRVETDELERTLGGTAILSSLDRALPSLRHRARNRRLESEIPLSTLVAVDRLTSFGSVWRRCTKAPRTQPMRGIESSGSKRTSLREPWAAPPFRHLSTGPCLHCITVHCLASSQRSVTSPRKGTASFPSTKNGACRPRLAPQCLHSLVVLMFISKDRPLSWSRRRAPCCEF